MELTPKDNSYKPVELWIDGNGMPIQMKFVEVNNDFTVIYLSNLQKNVVVKASEFQVNLPKETKIIRK